MTLDTARLRALAEAASRDGVTNVPTVRADVLLALLDERDALIHDVERHIAIASEAVNERDALAAMLREARDMLRTCSAVTHWPVVMATCQRIDDALDGAKGADRG